MSEVTSHDPRTRLAREKFFSMRPKPLERWIWQQGIPASAERVFWYHWDIGNRNDTWCSQVPIRIVGRDCCLDPATVTRAYQLLKRLDLLRREDPGRDPANPFQQATAVTEVRIPRELLTGLAREPSRPRPGNSARSPAPAVARLPAPPSTPPSREDLKRVFAAFSAAEHSRFTEASRHRRATMEFDGDTRLGPIERAQVLGTLGSLATARPSAPPVSPPPRASGTARRLPALELLRLQRSVNALPDPAARRKSLVREVAYSVEEGALARFPVPLAINVALKKIREGAWASPRRMPADWGRTRVAPESCSAAGQG